MCEKAMRPSFQLHILPFACVRRCADLLVKIRALAAASLPARIPTGP